MADGTTLRDELRDKTAHLHRATESALDLMGPSVSLERYLSVLRVLHAVYSRIEPAILAHGGWTELGLDMKARSKLPLLEADIAFIESKLRDGQPGKTSSNAAFASPRPLSPEPSPRAPSTPDRALDSFPAVLGAAYVVEGSTLGGAFIQRHISGLFGLAAGEGTRFFNCYGSDKGSRWKQFLEALNRVQLDAGDRQRAADGAVGTFELLLGRARSVQPG